MLSLAKTITSLTQQRRRWERLSQVPSGLQTAEPPTNPLKEVTGFGSNPGNLRMFTYVPDDLPSGAALVVVLHGCTQTAAGYDHGAGWSTLAARYGFALLLPEQQTANNPKRCFNWFLRGDTERGRGEALSIRQMVDRMVRDLAIDRRKIFVTGLSAGGAMTSVMLATYPDVFAGGAIIAGLPYRAATKVSEAYQSMFSVRERTAGEWGDLVREASPHRGPWPRVSVWHGDADAIVVPQNAAEIVKQWTDVHGLPAAPARTDVVDGYPREVWCDASGEIAIESYTITSMAHGTPLAPGSEGEQAGVAGAFLLDVGISSSYHIAKFFGLTGRVRNAPRRRAAIAPAARNGGSRETEPAQAVSARTGGASRETEAAEAVSGRKPDSIAQHIHTIITKALAAGGLLKR